MNAIDYAFEKNSIFSIKLFVDCLLDMADQDKFKNCFDKALILMISKGMDVQELVNSSLLYPPIWTKQTIFSDHQGKTICIYNNGIGDLEREDPKMLFKMGENRLTRKQSTLDFYNG
jgi:hypothetical protein